MVTIQGGGWRAALVGGILLGMGLGAPERAGAQANGREEAEKAARVARADSIRATLVLPDGDRSGISAMDVIRAPFDLLGGLLALPLTAGFLGYEALDEVGVVDAVTGTRAALADVGIELRPDLIGSRSWPALVATWTGLDPFYAEAGYSLRHYQLYGAGFRFGDEETTGLDLSGSFRDLRELHFWGVGLESARTDRSDYALERWEAGGHAWTDFGGPVRLSAGAAWERNDVGPGFDDARPNVQQTFDPDELYGALGETRYVRYDAGVDADFTRVVDLQPRGVRILVEAQRYQGLEDTESDFDRVAGDLRIFIPVTDRQYVGLRAMGEDRLSEEGDGVPFTHLADLGDDDGLRGYTSRRFMDRAMAAASAEWRYEVWWHPGNPNLRLEGFVFVDHGAVASSLDALEASDFLTTPGFGIRFTDAGQGVAESYVAFGGDKTRLDISFGVTF